MNKRLVLTLALALVGTAVSVKLLAKNGFGASFGGAFVGSYAGTSMAHASQRNNSGSCPACDCSGEVERATKSLHRENSRLQKENERLSR